MQLADAVQLCFVLNQTGLLVMANVPKETAASTICKGCPSDHASHIPTGPGIILSGFLCLVLMQFCCLVLG